MNTYKWTCLACSTPNILVHDTSKEGQVHLSCQQCGEPGVFEPHAQVVRMSQHDIMAVCSTSMQDALIDSAQSIANAGAPRIPTGIDYSDPTRMAKVPTWR